MQTVAGALFEAIASNMRPTYMHPPRQAGTPKRQHNNMRVVTIGQEEFRTTRGQRKKLARALTISRINAQLRGEIEIAPKYLSSAQRERLRLTREEIADVAGRAVRAVA